MFQENVKKSVSSIFLCFFSHLSFCYLAIPFIFWDYTMFTSWLNSICVYETSCLCRLNKNNNKIVLKIIILEFPHIKSYEVFGKDEREFWSPKIKWIFCDNNKMRNIVLLCFSWRFGFFKDNIWQWNVMKILKSSRHSLILLITSFSPLSKASPLVIQ